MDMTASMTWVMLHMSPKDPENVTKYNSLNKVSVKFRACHTFSVLKENFIILANDKDSSQECSVPLQVAIQLFAHGLVDPLVGGQSEEACPKHASLGGSEKAFLLVQIQWTLLPS